MNKENHESIVRDWKENASQNDEENFLFLRSFKTRNYGYDVDDAVNELHQTAFQMIDCTQCANCCKTRRPRFDEEDVERIAASFQMEKAQFIEKYLEPNPKDPPYRVRETPCPFLGADNRCTVYEIRPTVCRGYPYTDQPGTIHRTYALADNALVCPAVFWIVEQLRQRSQRRRRRR